MSTRMSVNVCGTQRFPDNRRPAPVFTQSPAPPPCSPACPGTRSSLNRDPNRSHLHLLRHVEEMSRLQTERRRAFMTLQQTFNLKHQAGRGGNHWRREMNQVLFNSYTWRKQIRAEKSTLKPGGSRIKGMFSISCFKLKSRRCRDPLI